MKKCAHCLASFEVTERDRQFYDRIKVPEPTHCPSCRMQRRFAYRNERNLYHRKCDLTGKQIISMYHSQAPFPVYEQAAWWGDDWDPLSYGREVDFSRPFFEQLQELRMSVPRIALLNVNRENSDYCNFTGDVKNSYLIFGSVYSEDCYYGSPYYSKNCVDTLVLRKCQWCYECVDCRECYACLYSQDCTNSDHLLFCYDLQGCSECIGCVGLRQKKYCIFNQQYSPEEYEKLKKGINLCDPRVKEQIRKKFFQLKLGTPHSAMQSNNVENVSGGHVYNSKNTFYSFFADNCEDCGYCAQVVDLKDCYDNNYTEENELCYEYLGMYGTRNTHFSLFCRHTDSVWYSDHCVSSSNLFGCNGVRNKQYCILNKQYFKEEYEMVIPKIIEHMKKTGEWGEFPPIKESPFAYNESVAQEFFPFEKEEVITKDWRWRDSDDTGSYQGPKIEIPQNIEEVSDDITQKILLCEATGRPFKVIKQELAFYRTMKLPIPRRCPDQRHLDRMSLRNPRKLWERQCSQCQKSIQTTYAPDRPEQILCEECYVKTLY